MAYLYPVPAPRLLFAVTTDLCYDQRMQRICTTLARAGYAVTLVGWQRPGSPPLTPQPYQQVRLSGWFQKGKLFYLEYNLRLFAHLLRQKADAWACADLDAALPTWARAALAGQPFVYDAHELFTEVPEVVGRPRVQQIWRWIENFIVPRARARYTVGPALARLFEQRHGQPFAVVRNVSQRTEHQSEKTDNKLIDPLPNDECLTPNGQRPTANRQPPTPTPYLLYQGALNAGRGLEALLEAMPQVGGRLVICGEGDLSAPLRAQAGRLGLLASGQVEFRGFVLPDALRAVTRRAAVGIMLLENIGLSYYYSLANKFFDYVQAGIPQVVVDFPEYHALNAEHEVATLLPNLEPAALAAALNRLLPGGDAAYRQRLQANCAIAREVWTWEREEAVLLEVYARVRVKS